MKIPRALVEALLTAALAAVIGGGLAFVVVDYLAAPDTVVEHEGEHEDK